MRDLHRYIAYVVPFGFLLLTLWALVAFLRNRDPGPFFWGILAVEQVILGLQIVAGAVLFLMGGRPPPQANVWLHYVYGGLFPLAVLVVAHVQARRRPGLAGPIFGFAGLVAFGLTFRALQTGLGVGVG